MTGEALARAMSDRDAAGRALGDLVMHTDIDALPEHLRPAAQEYADLAMVEELAAEAPLGPCLDCPHDADDHATLAGSRCSAPGCMCPGYVELTTELWEAERTAIAYGHWADGEL